MPRKKKEVIEEVKEEVKSSEYDPLFCANCGIRLNTIPCKHDNLNFCSVDCYNKVITS